MCDFWLDSKNECVCVSTSAQQPPTKSLIQWHRLTQLSIKKLCAAVCWKSETWAGWGEFLALLVGSTVDSTPWSLLIWAVAQSLLCGIQAFAENAQVWKAKLQPAVPKSGHNKTQSPEQVGCFHIALGEFYWYLSQSPSAIWLCNYYCLCYLECAMETKIETMLWNNEENEWKMKCVT